MDKPKICFVNTVPTWGGGEAWQVETILALKGEAEIVSISHPKGELQQKIKEYVAVFPFTCGSLSFLNPFKLYRLYRMLKRMAPDTIMFNTSSDFKMFTMPAKWAGVKKIVYRRDNGTPLSPHIINKFLLQKGITTFLPCSDFIKNAALSKDENLIPENKIGVVYNSISITKWDAEEVEELLEKDENTFYFGCIGRFSQEKGQLFLPEIAKLLAEKQLDFKILLAGKGPLEKELQLKIKETGTESYFEFLGFVRHSKDFMETIDCLLIPSLWEGLPTVAIEAMASSKAVVAFNVAGNPEVVRNNETGTTVAAYDVQLFAEAMTCLPEDVAKARNMGERGRALAESTFSREVTNEQLKEFLYP